MNGDLISGSRWRHRNGNVYTVLFLTNVCSIKPEYLTTVVYQGVVNKNLWSRPAHSWGKSFTRILENDDAS